MMKLIKEYSPDNDKSIKFYFYLSEPVGTKQGKSIHVHQYIMMYDDSRKKYDEIIVHKCDLPFSIIKELCESLDECK